MVIDKRLKSKHTKVILKLICGFNSIPTQLKSKQILSIFQRNVYNGTQKILT